MTNRLTIVVAIAAGTVAGAVASAVVLGSRQQLPSGRNTAAATTFSETERNEIRALQSRLSKVERSNTGVGQPPPERGDLPGLQESSVIKPVRATPAEHLSQLRAKVEREQVDETWAPNANIALTADLDELRKQGNLLAGQVDCRSSSCLVHVRWANYGEALNNYRHLVFGTSLNCSKAINLPDVEDPNAEVAVTAIYTRCRRDASDDTVANERDNE
jgi:hypothetical protein